MIVTLNAESLAHEQFGPCGRSTAPAPPGADVLALGALAARAGFTEVEVHTSPANAQYLSFMSQRIEDRNEGARRERHASRCARAAQPRRSSVGPGASTSADRVPARTASSGSGGDPARRGGGHLAADRTVAVLARNAAANVIRGAVGGGRHHRHAPVARPPAQHRRVLGLGADRPDRRLPHLARPRPAADRRPQHRHRPRQGRPGRGVDGRELRLRAAGDDRGGGLPRRVVFAWGRRTGGRSRHHGVGPWGSSP